MNLQGWAYGSQMVREGAREWVGPPVGVEEAVGEPGSRARRGAVAATWWECRFRMSPDAQPRRQVWRGAQWEQPCSGGGPGSLPLRLRGRRWGDVRLTRRWRLREPGCTGACSAQESPTTRNTPRTLQWRRHPAAQDAGPMHDAKAHRAQRSRRRRRRRRPQAGAMAFPAPLVAATPTGQDVEERGWRCWWGLMEACRPWVWALRSPTGGDDSGEGVAGSGIWRSLGRSLELTPIGRPLPASPGMVR